MCDSAKTLNNKIRFECCNRLPNSNECLKCAVCRKKYHYVCVSTTNVQYKELTFDFKTSWHCPACNRPKTGIDNSNTPVRATSNHSNDIQESSSNVTLRNKQKLSPATPPDGSSNFINLADVRLVIREELMMLLDTFKDNIMSHMNSKVTEISNQLSQVTESITFMEQEYENVKKEMQQKIETIKFLESENQIMRTNMQELNSRLTQIEQQSRANNLEIQCLPEHKNENLLTVVKQIATTINYNVKDTDIHLCTRVAKIQKNSSRPRSIIVKFSCPRIRDEFLAATITFNKKNTNIYDKLNTSHVGLGCDKKPIYIVEHLSPTQKSLHAACRIKARELKYRFVWVKGGQIFMRKSESSVYKLIKNMDSLSTLV